MAIQLRRDTAANWTAADPTLTAGQPGFETDTGKLKVGDGSTAWTSLDYIAGVLADGDKGDITVSGGVWSIDNGTVSLAKMANMATASLIYRKTAGAGAPELQTLATLKADLGLTGTNTGDQATIVGITGTLAEFNTALTGADFATGGGTATGTNTGDQATISGNAGSATVLATPRTIGMTGDVVWTSASFDGSGNVTGASAIQAGVVTLAMQANMATASLIYRKTAGVGAPEVQTLATLKADLGLTGTNSGDQTSVSGNAGTATALASSRTIYGNSFDGTANVTGTVTVTGVISSGAITSSSASGGIGYAPGAGGTVTQNTSKATAVTLDRVTGKITMNAAALAAGTIVTFVFNNSTLAAEDQIVCTHHASGTFGAYTINARVTGAGTASVAVRNNTAGSLSEALVIKFAVTKAVAA